MLQALGERGLRAPGTSAWWVRRRPGRLVGHPRHPVRQPLRPWRPPRSDAAGPGYRPSGRLRGRGCTTSSWLPPGDQGAPARRSGLYDVIRTFDPFYALVRPCIRVAIREFPMSRLFRRRPLAGLATLTGLWAAAQAAAGGGGGSAAPGAWEDQPDVAAVPALGLAGLVHREEARPVRRRGTTVLILLLAVSGATTSPASSKARWTSRPGTTSPTSRRQHQAKDPPTSGARTGLHHAGHNQDIVVPQHSGITTVSDLAGNTSA